MRENVVVEVVEVAVEAAVVVPAVVVGVLLLLLLLTWYHISRLYEIMLTHDFVSIISYVLAYSC
jgi:ABC-type spermidine/putrescine transport system permease subunit II